MELKGSKYQIHTELRKQRYGDLGFVFINISSSFQDKTCIAWTVHFMLGWYRLDELGILSLGLFSFTMAAMRE